MMIDETILVLAITDCRNHKLAKYPDVDCHCNLDFDKNITEPLKIVFANVIRYDFLKRYLEVGVKATNNKILDIVREERPEYVLWPTYMYEIQEATFRAIRDGGAIVVGWFFDDEVRFDDYSKWWIPYLDYILTTDKWSVDKYRKLGGNAIYSLNFSNPDYFRRLDSPKIYDVSFVGTNIANRQELVDTLKKKGVLVRAFGSGWSSGYVSFDDMVKIYNQSKINLSFMQSYGNGSRPQMKCKIFDICMCGGFLLCEYIPGIEEFYEINKEIVCFRDIEEAADKIDYYLKHEEERAAIAEAGWKRATSEHTNLIRLSNIFQKIENDIKKTKDDKNIINPKLSKMPRRIRKLHSNYHCSWGKALLQENYKKLWKDELALAISYNPFNIEAWCLYIIGRFPPSARPGLITLYDAIGTIKMSLLSRNFSLRKKAYQQLFYLRQKH
ncbi:MAG: glycosyltransferase [Methanophagales archaeon]|nr:glycosyltransferase [Methanophagales archaeon]